MTETGRLKKLQNTEKRDWEVYSDTKGSSALSRISVSVEARSEIVGEKLRRIETELEKD